jgi:hypothetical protein
MSDAEKTGWVVGAIGAIVAIAVFAIGVRLGHNGGRNVERQEWERRCLEAGVAQYVIVDPKTGRAELLLKGK